MVVLVLFGYYVSIVVYVLGVQMHLSVPRMTSKFIITDQQNWRMALVQLCLAITAPYFFDPSIILVAAFTALSFSLVLLALLEVLSLASPMSLLLQFAGLVMPTFIPGLPGDCLAIVLLSMSIDSKESAAYIRRYDRHILRLYRIYSERYGHYFAAQPKYIADVAMAILIVEILCRPKLFRLLETFAKATIYRSRPMSTGIMQVIANTSLSDGESIVLGIKYIKKLNNRFRKEGDKDHYRRAKRIASAYNGDDEYGEYFAPIYYYVRNGFFPS